MNQKHLTLKKKRHSDKLSARVEIILRISLIFIVCLFNLVLLGFNIVLYWATFYHIFSRSGFEFWENLIWFAPVYIFVLIASLLIYIFFMWLSIYLVHRFIHRKDAIHRAYRAFHKARSSLKLTSENVVVNEIRDITIGKVKMNMRIFICETPTAKQLEIVSMHSRFAHRSSSNAHSVFEGQHGIIHYYDFNGKNYFEKFDLNSDDGSI